MAEGHSNVVTERLPPWLRQDVPDMTVIRQMQQKFKQRNLNTVCQSARCPNIHKCWKESVATFMIMGENCTRSCRFCSVGSGDCKPLDPQEPHHIAQEVSHLELKYVVITSVCRDDIPDGGAQHFVDTICAIRKRTPKTKIEVLIPDFQGDIQSLNKVVAAAPDVISHNIETVSRLYPLVRPQADYHRTLDVLLHLHRGGESVVKSGFMVGLGERDDEIFGLMEDLKKAGCAILTIGQYLKPSSTARHLHVDRFVSPQQFELYKTRAKKIGFQHVHSAPLVRSSFLAEEGYAQYRTSVNP